MSTDGGMTWTLASGTTNWTYIWTPTTVGAVTIKVRGYDDSGNMESVENAENVITVNVTNNSFKLSLYTYFHQIYP